MGFIASGTTAFSATAIVRESLIVAANCRLRLSEEMLRRDPADLLAHLDQAMSVASPGPSHLTKALLEQLMREALAAARDGMNATHATVF